MPDLADLFHELIRFETELWNGVEARMRLELDLPLSRFEPLRVIADRADCRVHDIAEELVITVGGSSKLVDRLEAAGHCRRRANPVDRRSSIIELTVAGESLLKRASAIFEDELQRRLGTVPTRSLDEFTTLLARLRAANALSDHDRRASSS